MTTKVVYNSCFGGFSISREALTRMQELGFTKEFSKPWCASIDAVWLIDCPRHDPILIQVVEELGKRANGIHATLRIAEVSGPYRIEEYDGAELVIEPNDYEWITP
jgi:hypothetical protein